MRRRPLSPRQRRAQLSRKIRPARQDRRPPPPRPALRNVFTCQVNDRVEVVQPREIRRVQIGVKVLRIRPRGRASEQAHDLVPITAQHRLQVAAEQSRRSGEQDSHEGRAYDQTRDRERF